MEAVTRHVDAHYVLKLQPQLDALARIHQRLLEHLRGHDGACHLKGRERGGQPFLDLQTQLLIELHDVHELTHQLIALVLEQLMASSGSLETALELVEHHSGRSYCGTRQKASPP